MKNPLMNFTRRTSPVNHGPWGAMIDLQNEMERWFGSGLASLPDIVNEDTYLPKANFHESDSEYALQIDIPGIKKEDVNIEIEGNTLTVSGERMSEVDKREAKRHYTESRYGSFARSFVLPQVIDEKKVSAVYKDGTLKVTVPKAISATVKTVAIQ